MKNWKAVMIGALAGATVFFTLGTLRAQTALTVAQIESSTRAYVGSQVEVTGLASNIRSDTKTINGQKVPCIKLNLYKVDSKGKKGSRYIYVSLATNQFVNMPVEGEMARATGVLKWPYEIAAIDQ